MMSDDNTMILSGNRKQINGKISLEEGGKEKKVEIENLKSSPQVGGHMMMNDLFRNCEKLGIV